MYGTSSSFHASIFDDYYRTFTIPSRQPMIMYHQSLTDGYQFVRYFEIIMLSYTYIIHMYQL